MCRFHNIFTILSYKYPLERETHVAHLISLGFTPVEIAERLGHEGISVTYTYSHLYPSKQKELADRLDADHGERDVLDVEILESFRMILKMLDGLDSGERQP